MKVLFTPAILLMNRMTYPVKFIVLNLIVIIPLFTQTWSLVSSIQEDIDHHVTEQEGLSYTAVAWPLLMNIVLHEQIIVHDAIDVTPNTGRMTKVQSEIDLAIKNLHDVKQKLSQTEGVELDVDAIQKHWLKIKSSDQSSLADKQRSYSSIIGMLVKFIAAIGNASKLILDEEIEMHNLSKILLIILPQIIDDVQESSMLFARFVTNEKLSDEDFGRLHIIANRIRDNKEAAQICIKDVFREDNNIKSRLGDDTIKVAEVLQGYQQAIEKWLIEKNGAASDKQLFLSQFDKTLAYLFKMNDLLLPELSFLLKNTVQENSAMRNMAIFVALSVILILSYLFTGLNISVNQSIQQVGTATRQLAHGDLTTRLTLNTHDEMRTIGNDFNDMIDKFEALIQQIISAATQLTMASDELSTVAKNSAANIEKQRGETDQVATAMTEMSATVQEVARNAASAAGSATSADNDAQSGRAVVQDTSAAISQLVQEVENASVVIHAVEKDSEQIGTILYVIKDIAEQTNLLALNAAIEAARAGEQGRGFAVVADEVRTLASRTHQSTEEIEQMITQLQKSARNAVEVMAAGKDKAQKGMEQANEAAESLDAITRAVALISEMNTQIASAAEEQSTVSEDMSRNINNISRVSELTAEGALKTTQSSEQLSRLAAQLQALVTQFKIA